MPGRLLYYKSVYHHRSRCLTIRSACRSYYECEYAAPYSRTSSCSNNSGIVDSWVLCFRLQIEVQVLHDEDSTRGPARDTPSRIGAGGDRLKLWLV